jgi:hypothetical protein
MNPLPANAAIVINSCEFGESAKVQLRGEAEPGYGPVSARAAMGKWHASRGRAAA